MKDREQLMRTYARSRINLLSIVGFTIVNVLLTIFNASISFLFSASVPMIVAGLSMDISRQNGSPVFAIVGLVITAVMIGTYYLFYRLSRTKHVFLLISAICMVIDTAVLLLLTGASLDTSIIIDIGFHVYIVYGLFMGVKASYELNKLPAEEVTEGIAPQAQADVRMPVAKKRMLRHIVAWDYADGFSDDKNTANAQKVKEQLEGLKSQIPEIVEIHVILNPALSSQRRIVLDSVFRDEGDLAAYQVHPEHKRVSEFVGSVTKNRVCLDYYTE